MHKWMTITPCVFCALMLTGGCGTSKPVRYYTLSSTHTKVAEDRGIRKAMIGITQISLPEYLDRPQIVTSGEGNRLVLADFDRWAEPLAEAAARVLTADLVALLPEYQVRHRGWLDKRALDYLVTIEIVRFEGPLGGDVVLSTVWAVEQTGAPRERHSRQTEYVVSSRDASIDAYSQAMSLAMGKLAKDIAADILPDRHQP